MVWTSAGPARMGSWAAGTTAAAAAAALAIGVTTPPRSGPYCRGGCIGYPYTDAAAFVPRDYLWMYPATLAPLALVVAVACLHDRLPAGHRSLSRAGLSAAAIGACVLAIDYVLQLTVLQPGLLSGETEGLSPWSQYNPHGMFVGLEDLGYATLGVALVLLGAALRAAPGRPARAAAWTFLGGGAAITAALVLFATAYRARLDYRFEVIAVVLTWLALAAGGTLLAVAFARRA
ncbi:hypothetical protein [Dactylosporangium sp. NPDC049140]|uniref:hypothetical protein n=1 Tax=Dactylosporangium sp. NPDC049140 TaxID=3155647 RepID=UPI0033DC78B5